MQFDWKAIVKTVAPAIGTALGGPLGGAAMGALTNVVLGPDAQPDEALLAAAIQTADPELLLKIKQADQAFQVAMRNLDVDVGRLDNEDRASARAREQALRDWAPSALALAFVAGFFGIQYFVFNYPLPDGSEMVIARVLGTMDAAVVMILSYYFGSSRGSARKDEMIAKQSSSDQTKLRAA